MKKALFSFLFLCTACSHSPSAPLLPMSVLSKITPGTSELYSLDMGHPHSKAAFSVKINLGRMSDFQTQASQSGHAAYIFGAIQGIRVFLVSSASFPSPGVLTPVGGNIYTINQTFSGLSKDLTFHHVAPGSYYVAASVFTTGVGPFNAFTNMSKPTSFTYSEGHVAVSNSGGMGGPNNGRVEVDAQYQVTGTSQIVVPILLENEVGAKIETQVNLIDNP
ncbi:MAG: hypothetical protein IV090_08330 [Candidatus Sericytochromatia bacterium]|nr:hypothetical protein [Candidatus Sericytochromatia bacterium]